MGIRAHARLRHLCTGLLSLCLAAPVAAVWETSPRVRDLDYGSVLYPFYQQEHFAAITRLMVVQSRGPIPHHEYEARLLLGGLKLTYGLHDRAETLFRQLLGPEVPAAIRNRAWFHLGRIQYQKGLHEQAEASLQRMEGELGPALAGERQLLLALNRMARDDFAGAAAALRPWRGSRERADYGDFNLAVALIQGGDREAGLALLDRLGRGRATDAESLALRDRANVAAAEALLRADEHARARALLDRVRLDGPYSGRALLWSGWASTELGDPRRALVPWTRLQGHADTEPAAQEALLAVPYAYLELGEQTRAAAWFETAVNTLDARRAELRRAMAEIERGEMVVGLILRENLRGAAGRAPLPAQGYLVDLLAGHRFQEVFQNYLDLHALQRNLAHWAGSIDSFDDMLQAQEALYARRLPETRARLETLDLRTPNERRAVLAARFARAEQEGDAWALASIQEQRRRQRLQAVEERLSRLPDDDPEVVELRQRQALLQGLVHWEVQTDFAPRLWEARKGLLAVDAQLAELASRRRSLQEAEQHALTRFQGFAGRIEAQRAQIARLQPRVDATLAAHEQHLQAMALEALQAHLHTLDDRVLRARYTLARIYEAQETLGQPERSP